MATLRRRSNQYNSLTTISILQVCPNGGDKCKYKHALPKGYKLKKDMKVEVETREQTLEELLGNEWTFF